MLKTNSTIGMKDMRYLNLFRKITKIDTNSYFEYNNILFFCVDRKSLYKALGKDSENLKKLSKIIGKRIRVIPTPKSVEDAKDFIKRIISPLKFQEIEINNNEIILTADKKDKSLLFGRNKKRFLEMKNIIKEFFNKDFKII